MLDYLLDGAGILGLRVFLSTSLAGVSGGLGASLIQGEELTMLGAALVTGLSALFGMLSSASRVTEPTARPMVRLLLMNGGAVWIGAFSVVWTLHSSMGQAAMIGLGMGLAGTRALEVLELGTMGIVARITGRDPIERRELEQLLGEERKRMQAAISEGRAVGPTPPVLPPPPLPPSEGL